MVGSCKLMKAGTAPQITKQAFWRRAPHYGEVAEWLMAPVLKTGVPERAPGVRIPPSPPLLLLSTSCMQVIPAEIPS
jgi:hypothetical protein